MIEHLNSVRHCFEEFLPELGVTDPVSGLDVLLIRANQIHPFE